MYVYKWHKSQATLEMLDLVYPVFIEVHHFEYYVLMCGVVCLRTVV